MGLFGRSFVKDTDIKALVEEMSIYQRQLEDMGWINMAQDGGEQSEFIIGSFKKMLKRCRLFYHNDPLAGQWVNLTTAFVFSEGVSKPKAKDQKIQEVVDEFWNDPDNKVALTDMLAQHLLSNKIQYEGNIFFALFDDEVGKCKVRVLNTDEIDDVIRDPEDRMRTNFYKVAVTERKFNFKSDTYDISNKGFIYYADIDNYDPTAFDVPVNKLVDGCRVMQMKVNCDINDKFGVPDLYRGLDWMKAHKTMNEDVATLVKALSTIAWKKKVIGGPGVVSNMKAAMDSKTNLTNIRNSAGQTQIENQGVDMQSIKIETGGVSVGKDGARMSKLMVCAASSIFEHYFGDPSTGNLATAKSMELPMVKKFIIYQSIWRGAYLRLLNHVIDRKIEAGALPGRVVDDPKAMRRTYETTIDRTIDIDFPPIIEEDLKALAESLTIAIDGNLISTETAARTFLMGANINEIDEELKKIESDKAEREAKAIDDMLATAVDPATGLPRNPGAPAKQVPFKESSVETADEKKNRLELRHQRKTNYTMQRMSGYRKVLNGHFKELLESTKSSLKVTSHDGGFYVHSTEFGNALNRFTQKMQESARQYFPVAIQIGSKYIQSVLKDIKEGYEPHLSLFEANNKSSALLNERLDWNATYLNDSFEPDIHESFDKVVRNSYATAEEASSAAVSAITKYAGRVEQYVGAFWTVEESAVKEAGRDSDVKVVFAGPDDDHTCKGCEDAVNNGPYPISEAPIPGEQECLGRCRHALQVVE